VQDRRHDRGRRIDVVVKRGAAFVHVQVVVAVHLHALMMVVMVMVAAAVLDDVGQQVEGAAYVPVAGRSAGAAVEVGQRQV